MPWRGSIKQQALVGLCTALMIIFAQISIPVPFSVVPITFQTFAVILIAVVLEEQLATRTLMVYTLLGVIGLPVFSGFSGGLTRVFGPTGGFILGFIVMAFVIGWCSKRGTKIFLWCGTYIGIFVDYMMGVVQLAFITNMSIKEAIMVGAFPFLVKDIILAAVAIIVASRIKGIVRRGELGIS